MFNQPLPFATRKHRSILLHPLTPLDRVQACFTCRGFGGAGMPSKPAHCQKELPVELCISAKFIIVNWEHFM